MEKVSPVKGNASVPGWGDADVTPYVAMGNDSSNIRRCVTAIYCTMVLVDTLVSDVRDERHVKCRGHSHQFGERLDSHLAHDLASVGFHRDLARRA